MVGKRNFNRFLLLWAGELVSSVGGGLTSFGLGVYVFQQTGSAADMALITLLAFLPTLLLSVPAGVLADRYDRRLLMMLGDGCSAIGILLILICMCRGGASLTEICVGVTVSSVFSSLLEPAYRATVTDLLDAEEYSRASGMVSLAGSARYLISPVLAGALLTVSDIRLLLVIDICTFFLTVICAAGFLFFAMLPLANNCLDFLVRTNIAAELQGRAWGFIGFLSQMGYVVAYGLAGVLADGLGQRFQMGVGRGAAAVIMASGVMLSVLALAVYPIKAVRELEKGIPAANERGAS